MSGLASDELNQPADAIAPKEYELAVQTKMQFNGMVGDRDIREAAFVQKIHEANEETACAEACFTYPEFFPPRPCGRKGIRNVGTPKKDVLRFFNGIDHIEIAVVIVLVYKIGRNLHSQNSQIKSGRTAFSYVMSHCNMGKEKYCGTRPTGRLKMYLMQFQGFSVLSGFSSAYFSRNVRQKSAGPGVVIFLFFFEGIKWYPIASCL
jgi:hypothetical protein